MPRSAASRRCSAPSSARAAVAVARHWGCSLTAWLCWVGGGQGQALDGGTWLFDVAWPPFCLYRQLHLGAAPGGTARVQLFSPVLLSCCDPACTGDCTIPSILVLLGATLANGAAAAPPDLTVAPDLPSCAAAVRDSAHGTQRCSAASSSGASLNLLARQRTHSTAQRSEPACTTPPVRSTAPPHWCRNRCRPRRRPRRGARARTGYSTRHGRSTHCRTANRPNLRHGRVRCARVRSARPCVPGTALSYGHVPVSCGRALHCVLPSHTALSQPYAVWPCRVLAGLYRPGLPRRGDRLASRTSLAAAAGAADTEHGPHGHHVSGWALPRRGS
jgi:hypothetical protein